MRPPPRESSRAPPSLRRRPAAASPSTPRARRSTYGHRGSVPVGASATRAVQIGRPRTGLRRPCHLDGAPAYGAGGIAPPWDWVHSSAGPTGAAPRPPPSAASASLDRPVSRPTSFLPPPPSAPIHHHPPPVRAPSALPCRRLPLPIRHPSALPTAPPARPLWASPPPPSSYTWHRALNPAPTWPPRLPLPLAAPPPFSPPRLDNTRNPGPAHVFDLNSPYAGYGGPMSAATPHGGMAGPWHGYGGASTRHGGMAGPSHGYSGYGGPSGYFQMPFHAGGQHMSQPARHFTSSMSGFAGGPYADGPPNLLPHILPSYGPYGECSSHGGRVHRSHASPSWHPATMRDEDNALESSSGDNAAIVGDAVAVEEEASEGSMAGQGEGSSSDGDLDWSSADDSSDEDYEELCKVLGDAYGNDEDYEELYKALDDAFGDEEPAVIQAIKQLSWNLRSTLKLLKEAVLQGMHEESINRKLRRQNRKLRRQNRW